VISTVRANRHACFSTPRPAWGNIWSTSVQLASHASDDKRAGVWLEEPGGDGKSIENLPDMLQAGRRAARLSVAHSFPLFEGGNRFGPQANLFLHFKLV